MKGKAISVIKNVISFRLITNFIYLNNRSLNKQANDICKVKRSSQVDIIFIRQTQNTPGQVAQILASHLS